MKHFLNKIVNNEFVDVSTIFKMQRSGLVQKISFSQYVITEKGFKILNEK